MIWTPGRVSNVRTSTRGVSWPFVIHVGPQGWPPRPVLSAEPQPHGRGVSPPLPCGWRSWSPGRPPPAPRGHVPRGLPAVPESRSATGRLAPWSLLLSRRPPVLRAGARQGHNFISWLYDPSRSEGAVAPGRMGASVTPGCGFPIHRPRPRTRCQGSEVPRDTGPPAGSLPRPGMRGGASPHRRVWGPRPGAPSLLSHHTGQTPGVGGTWPPARCLWPVHCPLRWPRGAVRGHLPALGPSPSWRSADLAPGAPPHAQAEGTGLGLESGRRWGEVTALGSSGLGVSPRDSRA